MTSYSSRQFAVFRLLFGVYLVVLFARVIPYASELFGDEALPLTVQPLRPLPNLLAASGRPMEFVAVLTLLAVLFTAGVLRRSAALLLWYGLYCLVHRNPSIEEISLSYVSWLLLACVLIPKGESFSLRGQPNPDWAMPPIILFSAWLVLAVSYAIAGGAKLTSSVWTDGSLLEYILDSSFSRDWWFTRLVRLLPPFVLSLATWTTLAAEMLFLPMCFFRRTRMLAWSALALMNFGIMLLLDIAQVSIAMLLFHLFVFDTRWIRGKSTAPRSQT